MLTDYLVRALVGGSAYNSISQTLWLNVAKAARRAAALRSRRTRCTSGRPPELRLMQTTLVLWKLARYGSLQS